MEAKKRGKNKQKLINFYASIVVSILFFPTRFRVIEEFISSRGFRNSPGNLLFSWKNNNSLAVFTDISEIVMVFFFREGIDSPSVSGVTRGKWGF